MTRIVAVVCVGLMAVACGPRAPSRPTNWVRDPLFVAKRTADAAAPGAAEVGWMDVIDPGSACGFESMPSAGFQGDDLEVGFCAHSELRRFDWRAAVDAAQMGAPEVAVAHAAAQAEVLAQYGFIALDSAVSVRSRNPGASVCWTARDGSGGQRGGTVETRPDLLVHRRIYYAPGTTAFVLVRTEYEATTGVATTEVSVLAASPGSADRDPSLRRPVTETVAAAK